MVRITQQNDWVVFIIIGCISLYVFMFRSLQRDSTVKEFLMQKFPDASNNLLSWIIISFVFCLVFAAFISQYIPVVPKKVGNIHVLGYELNKFGFTFLVILGFYFIRNMLTYIFFAGTGTIKKWDLFYFTVSKFYFCISVIIIILCVISYFYPDGDLQRLPFYFGGFLGIFLFKLLFYFFHKSDIMPQKWYYKFLYICTLQIVPVLVLWKVLFF
ncbi:DUF4271 domain-containing protein [Kaistella jeonii]|uniref:DUF4271 domain-containing protein n=1 Tax=Kaistella jeonii TaxID=266749 RepID=UPI0008F05784|nr:DUF4271 domain-containing protein [Kaistella jeonii]SFB79089.1 protein of unknown function [Kaistella jeonii]VEI96287.1 Uncharacterised protein [Kaistella jeonii]